MPAGRPVTVMIPSVDKALAEIPAGPVTLSETIPSFNPKFVGNTVSDNGWPKQADATADTEKIGLTTVTTTLVGGLMQVPLEQNTFRFCTPAVTAGTMIEPEPSSVPFVRVVLVGHRPVNESTLPTVAVKVPGWVGAVG